MNLNDANKGQEYIIKAISKLNKQGHNFEYELVGAGDNSYLKNLAIRYGIEDKVRFKGLLLHDEVITWLDSIDIYAQPSKQEGLPRALIEALSRGCPCIGSTTAGIPELLQKENIFRSGNINEICLTLERIIRSDMLNLSKRNFEKAKEYEVEKLNSKRNKIYKKYLHYVKNGSVDM